MIRETCVYRNWTTRWIFSRIFYAIAKNRTFYLPGPVRLCRVERLLDWWVFSFDFVENSQTCFPPTSTAVGTHRYTSNTVLYTTLDRAGLNPVFVNFQFQLRLAPITLFLPWDREYFTFPDGQVRKNDIEHRTRSSNVLWTRSIKTYWKTRKTLRLFGLSV